MRLIIPCLGFCLFLLSSCSKQNQGEKQLTHLEKPSKGIKPNTSPGVKDMCIRSACALPAVPGLKQTAKMKFSLLQVPYARKTVKNNPISEILQNKTIKDSLRWVQLQSLSQSWAKEAHLIQTQQDLYHSQLCALEVIRVHLEKVAVANHKLYLGRTHQISLP